MPISFLFFRKRKRKKQAKERKRNRCDHSEKTSLKKDERSFKGQNYCLCDHFYKNARKTLAFSGCFIRFSLDLMLWVVAVATRQYFVCEKRRACLCERVSACRSGLPRAFFLLSGASFFFLSRKKEERCGKIV